MNDRKKVINELQFQLNSKEVKEQHYPVPLSVSDTEIILALLKKQDAKCMTKEELSGLHEQQFVWLEGKDSSLYCIRIIGICAGKDGVTDIQYDTMESYIEQSTEKYGVKFRLWTAQPTDEQRQTVKWE